MREPGPFLRVLPLLITLFVSMLVLDSLVRPRRSVPALVAAIGLSVPPPTLSAESYVVKWVGEGTVLLRRREWKRVAPASLTKIMTVLIAREVLPPDARVRFAGATRDAEEKTSGVRTGEVFGRDDAIRFALVDSANDAALALAEAVREKVQGEFTSPNPSVFPALMNERAQELGLADSYFQNPTGLDAERHVMTATDLSRLAEYVWNVYPDLWGISRGPEAMVRSASGHEYRFYNTNLLLKEFPAIQGSKTGFTDHAKGALLFFYPVRPDRLALVVLLRSDDRFSDGRKIIEWLEAL